MIPENTEHRVAGMLNLHNSEADFVLPTPFGELPQVFEERLLQVKYDHTPAGYAKLGGRSTKQLFVPAKGQRIYAASVGQVDHEQGLGYATKLLLTMNSEANDLRLKDLVYDRVFSRLEGHYFVCVVQSGPNARILILTRNVSVYLLGVSDIANRQDMLIWTNERGLEQRMASLYGNRFCYYRFPEMNNGCLAIQPSFLCSRYQRFTQDGRERMFIFSALERLIERSSRIAVNKSVVNVSTTQEIT